MAGPPTFKDPRPTSHQQDGIRPEKSKSAARCGVLSSRLRGPAGCSEGACGLAAPQRAIRKAAWWHVGVPALASPRLLFGDCCLLSVASAAKQSSDSHRVGTPVLQVQRGHRNGGDHFSRQRHKASEHPGCTVCHSLRGPQDSPSARECSQEHHSEYM